MYDSSTALWLQGKGLQGDQKQETETEEKSGYAVGRTEEFNRGLREQPTDTQLWIQFIRYQVKEALLGFELNGSESNYTNLERSPLNLLNQVLK